MLESAQERGSDAKPRALVKNDPGNCISTKSPSALTTWPSTYASVPRFSTSFCLTKPETTPVSVLIVIATSSRGPGCASHLILTISPFLNVIEAVSPSARPFSPYFRLAPLATNCCGQLQVCSEVRRIPQ